MFLVDVAPGLDTGCAFNDRSPLVFDIPVDRVVGDDIQKLVANGLLPSTVELSMPAFDVDYDANSGGGNAPERDRVTFNGHVVPGEFLRGANNVWHKNVFRIPIEQVKFPSDPKEGGTVTPLLNRVEIQIDVGNTGQIWCTEIDWASLKLEKAVRPVVGVHGIFSQGSIWNNIWIPRLKALGIPMTNELNMGSLDSIASNARKIALQVEAAKRRYGVDKVNIVAHSKGGLDSRHFAEFNDSVERIVQLGTPNGGSPLADVIQAGALVTLGLPRTILINALAGPAGVQLTTLYMANYNSSHGRNPNVDYISVAGNYNPSCPPLIPFCNLLNLSFYVITLGAGDGVVPVWSAHILDYTCDLEFKSEGLDFDALHTNLHASGRLFEQFHEKLYPGTRSCAAQRASALSEETAPPIATGSVGGEIESGQTHTHTIPVDQSVPTMFTLLYPSDTLGLVLVSPSGRRIDPTITATDPAITYEGGDILGGRAAIYGLPSPEVGVWTVEVTAGAIASALPYTVQARLQGADVVLAGPAAASATSIGGQVTLTATLTDAGQPVGGATVAARIGRPDGTTGDFTMRDDGVSPDPVANDGSYSVRVADHKLAGFQPVAFSASGLRANGALFSRQSFHLITVASAASTITGIVSDSGEDTDGDGLFNHLVVQAGVNVSVAGSYRLQGELVDRLGNVHEAAQIASLTAGTGTIALRFGGEALFNNGVDGPYRVSLLRLFEETADGTLPAAELVATAQTNAYPFAAFQHRAIRVSGNSASTGLDTDNDRLYDVLEVSVEVAIDHPDFYEWSGVLADRNGNELGFAADSGQLVAGTNFITFRFDAVPIGRAAVDGPYYLRDVLIVGGGNSAIVDQTFSTPPFRASEFEGYRGVPQNVTPVPVGGPLVLAAIGLALAGLASRRLRLRVFARSAAK